jgi:Zn-finger nucleic acid-binding protein
MKMVVNVWDDRVEIDVHQRSKTVWIARGEYKGKYHETKGSSAASAAKWWADAAKYHSN